MTNSQGTEILEKFRNKKLLSKYQSKSATFWPNQDHPDPSYFNLWLHGIKTICNFNETGALGTAGSLGEWIQPPHRWILHDSYIHTNHRSVMLKSKHNNKWKKI
jgi:hypothetical protein